MMFKRKITWIASSLFLLAVIFLAAGCSTKLPEIRSPWSQSQIQADGMDHEWSGLLPQYDDKEERVSVRVMNNADAVFVCVSVQGDSLRQKILMNGLALTLDPEGETIPPFKIEFNSLNASTSSVINLPDSMEITYPYSSGPMAMSFAEAREKGVEIGMGYPETARMVFEAAIGFSAISSFGDIQPGTRLTLKIEAKGISFYPSFFAAEADGRPGAGTKSGKTQNSNNGKPRAELKKERAPFEAVMDLVLTAGAS
ncbi:MAG: hypothetical protein KKC20_00385 [Proteobacteria bacterium]|nr:hypothetical protein [Pseudomonadota bacterium]